MHEILGQVPSPEKFDIETSPAREAYKLLGATTPLELSNLYSDADQILMRFHTWDYKDPEQIPNRVRSILDKVQTQNLSEEERGWINEILWFWHHHAISCAVWRYKDKTAAQSFAIKALELQSENHPNKITRLLYLLVNDNLAEAEQWLQTIEEEPEKTTATELVQEFKEKNWFE